MDKLINSKRFQAALIALIAIAVKILYGDKIPVTEEQLQYLIGVAIALILGDSIRPIDPAKYERQKRGIN